MFCKWNIIRKSNRNLCFRNMSSTLNFIKEINNKSMQWTLKVRVTRLWHVRDRSNPDNPFSIDMILQDAKGDRIQASIGRQVMRMFKSKVTELGLYVMKNFLVASNNVRLKTNKHNFKLGFTQRTTVEECNDPQFDLSIFQFRSYNQLINGEDVDMNELFDVIGEVTSYGQVKTVKQGGSRLIDIELQDHENAKIKATCWGDFVDQILPYLDASSEKPLIVVMQLIKAHKFQDKYSVENTWNASKLWINTDLPQVNMFRSRLIEMRGHACIRISQMSSQHNSAADDELSSGNLKVISIAELVDCQQEGSFWIYATIILLDIEKDWSYLGCKKCTKKVDKLESKLYCPKCAQTDPSVDHMFRIPVRVFDESGFIGLLLWDREAKKLIGRSANELAEGLIETSSAAADLSYPLELDYILERKLLFKVLVKKENIAKQKEIYDVMKICDDPDLIKEFNLPSSEEKLTDSDINNDGAAVGDKDFTDSMADTDELSPTKTPAKINKLDNRSSAIDVADENNAQLSSNTVRRVIKKEKK